MLIGGFMPPSKYNQKCHTLYFESENDLKRWKNLAHEARVPLTKWIIATVEKSLDSPDESIPASHDIQKMRQENIRLRKDNESLQQSLSRSETELFNLKHAAIKNDSGFMELDSRLISALQDGCVWDQQSLLEALGVDWNDIDAVQTISGILQRLQDAGIITEERRGWKWKK